jgi:hypothetical protein
LLRVEGIDLTMLALILAVSFIPSVCPVTIGIGGDGALYSDRMNGWYRVSPKSLAGNLQAGCYNDNDPSPVTSVKVFLAPGAAKPRVDLVFSILKKVGWDMKKVDVETWTGSPKPPR